MRLVAWLKSVWRRLRPPRTEDTHLPPPPAASGGAPERGPSSPEIAHRPVFAAEVTQESDRRLRILMMETEPAPDRKLLSLLRRAVKNDGVDLPALPEDVQRIRRLVSSPDVSIPQLAHTIQREPAIAAKFLAVANSTFYARGRRVTSTEDAIIRIGLNQASILVTAIVARSKLFRIEEYQAEANLMYAASLASGAMARHLAGLCRVSRDDAFMAGFFHDLGRIYILSVAAGLKRGGPKQTPSGPGLQHICNVLDDCLSAVVAESWSYEPNIVTALAQHNLPPKQIEEPLVHVVAAADHAARRMVGLPDDEPERLGDHLAALGVRGDDELTERLEHSARAFMAELGGLPAPQAA